MNQELPNLYTITQAAKILDLSVRVVHYHVKAKGLGRRIGAMVVLTEDELEILKQRNKTPGVKRKDK